MHHVVFHIIRTSTHSWIDHTENDPLTSWDANDVVVSAKISESFLSELEKQLSKPDNLVEGINIRVVPDDGTRNNVTTAADGVNNGVRFEFLEYVLLL